MVRGIFVLNFLTGAIGVTISDSSFLWADNTMKPLTGPARRALISSIERDDGTQLSGLARNANDLTAFRVMQDCMMVLVVSEGRILPLRR
jgi:hypothetical protein